MKNRIVLIQGAFDIINYGHIKALHRAKSEGDYLIVALNSNELLLDYKKKTGVLPYWQKKVILESIRPVDKVICAYDFSPLSLLNKHNIDVYCYTKEWEETKQKEIAFMKSKGGRCVVMPRYKHAIPTSQIKKTIIEEYLSQQ